MCTRSSLSPALKNGNTQEIREFGATTRELLEMADWLKDGGCEMVAMESTASYWKPLYNIFESSDLNAIVVNARHMKAVPGRKTDVKDAEWIADLLTHGLLQASYIPDKDQRELRELVRYRKSLVGERNRELNRLQRCWRRPTSRYPVRLRISTARVPGTSWSTYFQENRLTLLNMTFSMKRKS